MSKTQLKNACGLTHCDHANCLKILNGKIPEGVERELERVRKDYHSMDFDFVPDPYEARDDWWLDKCREFYEKGNAEKDLMCMESYKLGFEVALNEVIKVMLKRKISFETAEIVNKIEGLRK